MNRLLESDYIKRIFKKYYIEFEDNILTINKSIPVDIFVKIKHELLHNNVKLKDIIIQA